jgi:NADH-quinone oxidoreductase subunit H
LDQAGATPIVLGVLHIVVFLAKVVLFMGIFIWVRWMWPRFRYDQLMNLGWRVFIPLALANILATAVWLWFQQIMGWS